MDFFRRFGKGNEVSDKESESDLEEQFDGLGLEDQADGPRRITRPRRVQGPELHQEAALTLLSEATGFSKRDLRKYLYKAEILDKSNENYANILLYVKNSQEHGFGIEVVNIIRLVRNNDFEFQHEQKHSKRSDFRMILWHGTQKQFVPSILSNGFTKPPDKKQMFGVGCYFADRASKSAQYCDGTSPGKIGYMFLCDVKLGKMFKAKNPHNEFSSAPSGFNSVKCCGENIPDWKENNEIDGSVLPLGKTIKSNRFPSFTVKFNEYISYEPERIKVKYLVIVKFNAQKC